MVRTQILLDEETHEALRRRAFKEHKPLAAIALEILGEGLGVRRGQGKRRRKYGFTFIGLVRGEPPDVSERHDEYLGKGSRW